MDTAAIQSLIGNLPGSGIAALAIWFALKKDGQATALMAQLGDLAKGQALASAEVKASIDGLRDAIRVGTRS